MTTRAQTTTAERARSRRSAREGSLLFAALTASVVVLTSCGAPCRGIDTRPLELTCADTSAFVGELHFDSAAPFDTFLRQQCLDGDDAVADRVLASVDFTEEAVFVARGNHRVADSRCLASRELGEAQVCTNGLKLSFHDEERVAETCPGTRWTVAFVLAREDLRAALDAAP